VDLPFDGGWAAYLGPERGYLYLAGDSLDRLRPDLTVEHIASGVGEVSVAPDLSRIAFTVGSSASGEIDGYDLALRARYVLLRDGQSISSLAWSPNGLRLAYVLAGATTAQNQLRVKSLTGTGAVTSVATGEIAEPAWLADSNYITFSALIQVDGQARWRVFRINASLPTPRLTPQLALAGILAADATGPRPSPDGHQIAFLSGPAASAQIWLMNADGSGLQRLTGFDAGTFPYSCRGLHWAGF
jgi:Tol biopolymer transport system component